MADFEALLQASLDINKAKSDFESFKKSIESQTIKIKLDTDFVGNNSDFTKYFTGIEKQAQNAGKNIGKSYNTAIQNQIESMARTQRNAFSEPLNNEYIDKNVLICSFNHFEIFSFCEFSSKDVNLVSILIFS